ncbi:MAG: tRNA epoxyqueuosine(34) reductase QueG [Planctomycetes bacterium]|nr:tRNA epoxyqueuosine(34) reductase QueG [Planctomycetota bacterium]
MSLAEEIKAKGLESGFDLVGITDAGPIDNEQFKFFTDWLALGYAGRMNYMRENLEKRTNPAKLLENAQSVICVGLNYTPSLDRGTRAEGQKTRDETGHLPSSRPMGRVANYAQYEDYHVFIKKGLSKLVDFISSLACGNHKFKICVDSVPLAERSLAARAGLGFIGKNHTLINPGLGPQIFLGEIITSVKLQTDEPIAESCSNCNKCIEACPTGALRTDGQFDANKCISYLTIEYKGQTPADLAEKTGDRLFGCDECVLACPYQENAPVCKNQQFKYYNDRARVDLGRILNLTEADFDAEFADSPINRLGLDRLKRNAHICLVNATRREI